MKKTNRMATIVERTHKGGTTYIERRIYENEDGVEFVKINRAWFSLAQVWNFSSTIKVDVWF